MYSFNKNACPLLCYDDNPNRIGLEHGAITHPWIYAFQVRHINIYVQCVKKKENNKIKNEKRLLSLHVPQSSEEFSENYAKNSFKKYWKALQFHIAVHQIRNLMDIAVISMKSLFLLCSNLFASFDVFTAIRRVQSDLRHFSRTCGIFNSQAKQSVHGTR